MIRALLLLSLSSFGPGCSSTEVVRLRPALLAAKAGRVTGAVVQVRCLSFNIFTMAIPRECDLERVLNRQLMGAARRAGAHEVTRLHFEATPDSGFWWLSRLLGFRGASARAILLMDEPEPDRSERPTRTPASTPASAPGEGQ